VVTRAYSERPPRFVYELSAGGRVLNVTGLGPTSAADTLAGPIKSITSNRGGAGLAFFGGLALALWSASGYIGTFMQAANVIYETPEGRPIWKRRPLQLLLTLVMVVLTALVAVALVLTGPIVKAVAAPLGLSDTAVMVWDIAKWPVLVLVVLSLISLLYYAAPNVKLKKRGFRWVTRGALLGLVVWLVASALLGLGTAMVYPTLLATIADVAEPAWRGSAVGVYRMWRDLGFAVGAIVAGLVADAAGIAAAIWLVAVVTAGSGIIVLGRMRETRPDR